MLAPVGYIIVPKSGCRSVLHLRMKFYVAVLCIVLLQGAYVNCQSSAIDSAVSTINSVYQQYSNGTLFRNIIQKVRECLASAIKKLVQLQNYVDKLPSPTLPTLPPAPQTTPPPVFRGRVGGWPQWRN